MRGAAVKTLVLISILSTFALGLPNDPPALQPYPGSGMFLMLSDIHFDPYADPAILKQLGAKPLAACQAPASGAFAKFGSDTNYPLLKSTLDEVVSVAAQNHIHYDYAVVTGDLLAHNFDARYQQCVGGDVESYRQFAADTMRFVHGMITQALPGIPVFTTLGNNDTDNGDYAQPSAFFLRTVGQDWSRSWGTPPAAARAAALASLARAGNYALPHPTVRNHEMIVLNTNLWAARNAQACSEHDPDPGGQFQWLTEELNNSRRAGGTVTLIMHVLPGIDGMQSSAGLPTEFWTDLCTRKLSGVLSDFRGVVGDMYAGHIHRDDFRLFPDRDGKPLCTIHIVPAVSPVYLNNPAVEIGWYDQRDGALRDYATVALDLGNPHPAWSTEYLFTRAYARPRPDLAALEDLSRAIHNADAEVSKKYAKFYGAGVNVFLTPANWLNYSCAQTEIFVANFAKCRGEGASAP